MDNLAILRAFLTPIFAGLQHGLHCQVALNGMLLTHNLVECRTGFYLRVRWRGEPDLLDQLEHIANTQAMQLHLPSMIFAEPRLQLLRATVYIPGGNTLVMSRKLTVLGHENDPQVDGELRRRFPDLAMTNFGIGPVHQSYYLMEPTYNRGWSVQLVIPIIEDHDNPVVLFRASLPPYEGIGAIYVPKELTKFFLISDTGLDIVCGQQGELCSCYRNLQPLGEEPQTILDLDYLSCWLEDGETRSEVRREASCAAPGPRISGEAMSSQRS